MKKKYTEEQMQAAFNMGKIEGGMDVLRQQYDAKMVVRREPRKVKALRKRKPRVYRGVRRGTLKLAPPKLAPKLTPLPTSRRLVSAGRK